jgi:hypothetical protein
MKSIAVQIYDESEEKGRSKSILLQLPLTNDDALLHSIPAYSTLFKQIKKEVHS